MAFSEKGVLQATLAAIDDVNAHGGVLGRPLKAVIADGASNEKIFAQQAEQLLAKDKVAVIFGGWTSASRKAMLPVLAAHDGLLFYPVQYEGIEQSANVIYMGMAPNQQLYPALTYMHEHFGKKVLLVGSDYIYPRMANAIARPLLTGLGATICGEVYVPLGSQNVDALVQQVKQCQPDYIVNTVNGDSNLALFKALRGTESITPILSMSLSETELRHLITFLGIGVTQAHYVSWGYLQSLDTPENEAFVRQLQMTLPNTTINHPMKVAWDGVHLWANAANLSGVVDGDALGKSLAGMSYASATGVVSIDIENRHLWQPTLIGKAQPNGSFALVWQSQGLVAPNPWPLGKDHAAWQQLEQDWYQQWGGQWQAP
jgi:urea transport system substrate-binding protein